MADYIDRKELIDFIKLPDNPLSQNEFMRNFITGMIVDAPSVDDVEVVRCKDCTYKTKMGLCLKLVDYECFWSTPEDFFCAWGEKDEV